MLETTAFPKRWENFDFSDQRRRSTMLKLSVQTLDQHIGVLETILQCLFPWYSDRRGLQTALLTRWWIVRVRQTNRHPHTTMLRGHRWSQPSTPKLKRQIETANFLMRRDFSGWTAWATISSFILQGTTMTESAQLYELGYLTSYNMQRFQVKLDCTSIS